MRRVGGAVVKHSCDRAEIPDSNLQGYAHGTLGLARDVLSWPAVGQEDYNCAFHVPNPKSAMIVGSGEVSFRMDE